MTSVDSTKFTIHYVKQKPLDLASLEKSFEATEEDMQCCYNPFQIKHFQNYNPVYSLFFELSEKSYNKIALNHQYHFLTMNTVVHHETQQEYNKPVFIKYAPLIDPIRYMTGKYKVDTEKLHVLPNPFSKEEDLPLQKIAHHNNTSYTDNFFSFLTSTLLNTHGFVHGLDYYGSFLGVQTTFKANISDDLEYLNASEYFSEHMNKLFTVSMDTTNEFANFGSRRNKKKLEIEDISDTILLEEIEVVNALELSESKEHDNDTFNEVVYEKESPANSTASSINSSNNSETNYSVGEDDDEDDDGSGSEDWLTESDESGDYGNETSQYAYIKDFPVQLICLEKCDGTMDELFVRDSITVENGAAALMQVIMTLIAYQKAFHFTHNDLHTNNIMYVNTDVEYLYYRYNKKIYKVPTYGKIFKIIDFGRSIYKYKGRQFFSDSFAPGGDGATQYNCEPFMNEKKPRIDPNYSFDLCRLGCSIYDFVIEDDENPSTFDDLQKTVYRWCIDDNEKNILYKRNGEERYPNFKLYKMIARTVHNHTPQEQLDFPYFKQFLTEKKLGSKVDVLDLDELPVYVQ